MNWQISQLLCDQKNFMMLIMGLHILYGESRKKNCKYFCQFAIKIEPTNQFMKKQVQKSHTLVPLELQKI